MSYPYSDYPQYPQFPKPPGGPDLGGSIEPPPETPGPGQPTYTPVPSDLSPAEVHSREATNIAAGKGPTELFIKIPAPAADYPFLMYDQQDRTKTKAAKDEKEKGELAGKGYGDNPPKEDPNGVTPEMLQALVDVWTKAGDTLKTLVQLVQQQQKQMQAASGILGAGQQQQADPAFLQQPQYPGYSPQTGD